MLGSGLLSQLAWSSGWGGLGSGGQALAARGDKLDSILVVCIS